MRAPRATTTLVALLLLAVAAAGCLEDAPGATGPGDQSTPETTVTERGVRLTVAANRTAIAPGEAVGVAYEATNVANGDRGYREGCASTWSVRVLDPEGEKVNTSQPMGVCLGFSEETLSPGERVNDRLAWNGTRWNGDGFEAVAPGNYTVEVTFHAMSADGGEEWPVTAGVAVAVTEGSLPQQPRKGGDDANRSDDGDDDAHEPRINATANRTAIAPGGAVNVTFNVTNTLDEAITYRHGCLQSWEFRVVDAAGEDVTPPRFTCEGFQERELAPGESVSVTYPWDGTARTGDGDTQPAPPGRYAIAGAFSYATDDGRWQRVAAAAHVTVQDA